MHTSQIRSKGTREPAQKGIGTQKTLLGVDFGRPEDGQACQTRFTVATGRPIVGQYYVYFEHP